MRLPGALLGMTILCCIAVTACGRDQADLSPDNIVAKAFDCTEDTFFELFGADKDAAAEETSDSGGIIYDLGEVYRVNGENADVSVEFKDGQWLGITYSVKFSDGEDYLKSAYDYVCAYDQSLYEKYGTPLIYNETTFLKSCDSYEAFLEECVDETNVFILNAGDIYEIDDMKVTGVWLSANDTEAVVSIKIYRYTDREI